MSDSTPFSPDYATARQRFREAAERLRWRLEQWPIEAAGPSGEQLTIDVACSNQADSSRALVITSGLHGVEGILGSALQVDLLRNWARQTPPPVRCLFLHGLNPFGFAWLRRFDEQNIDPNRNFLLAGQAYEGAPPGYAELDGLLNPRYPPSRWDAFLPRAAYVRLRRGSAAVRQAVAAGQYEFPQGLFYGGAEPGTAHRLLPRILELPLRGSRRVVHLDLHTGLGRSGHCKLLLDYPLDGRQHAWFTRHFGAGAFETHDAGRTAYQTRGSLGQWCVAQHWAADYLYACAEFGTYGPLRVLAGLRAENQAHHWGRPEDAGTLRARRRLKELFCPSAGSWQQAVLERGRAIVEQAVRGLVEID